MTKLVFDKKQAEILRSATESVMIVDEHGNLLGHARRPFFTPEEIADAERRSQSPGPWRTTQEVMERLRSLGADVCDTP
jgi:hypothetical protein